MHLLFGPRDARLNEMILESAAPERDDLAQLYLVLRDLARDAADDAFEITNAELAERVKTRRPKTRLTDKGVSAGIGVFRELGLVESEGAGAYRRLRLLPRPRPSSTWRARALRRGPRGVRDVRRRSRRWVLEAPAAELLARVNRPILPDVSAAACPALRPASR